MTGPVGLGVLLALVGGPQDMQVQGAEVVSYRMVDVNDDGQRDRLLVFGDDSLRIALHRGGRFYEEIPQSLPRLRLVDVLAADLNGDGHTDLYLVARGANAALIGDGTGAFVEATRALGLADSGVGRSASLEDLDRDGRADLVLRNHQSDVVFWGLGGGLFEREALQGAASGGPGPVYLPNFSGAESCGARAGGWLSYDGSNNGAVVDIDTSGPFFNIQRASIDVNPSRTRVVYVYADATNVYAKAATVNGATATIHTIGNRITLNAVHTIERLTNSVVWTSDTRFVVVNADVTDTADPWILSCSIDGSNNISIDDTARLTGASGGQNDASHVCAGNSLPDRVVVTYEDAAGNPQIDGVSIDATTGSIAIDGTPVEAQTGATVGGNCSIAGDGTGNLLYGWEDADAMDAKIRVIVDDGTSVSQSPPNTVGETSLNQAMVGIGGGVGFAFTNDNGSQLYNAIKHTGTTIDDTFLQTSSNSNELQVPARVQFIIAGAGKVIESLGNLDGDGRIWFVWSTLKSGYLALVGVDPSRLDRPVMSFLDTGGTVSLRKVRRLSSKAMLVLEGPELSEVRSRILRR